MSESEEDKLKSLVPRIYEDLAQPAIQQLGRALGTVLGLVNRPLALEELKNKEQDLLITHNLKEYSRKLNSLPDESIVPVSPELGVPILEKLFYVSDESLIDLYTRLLTTCASSEHVQYAHPSFANIVTNLSPDEAKILKHFSEGDICYVVPFLYKRTDVGYAVIRSDEFYSADLLKVNGIDFPHNVKIYAENLTRLGLFEPSMEHDSKHGEPDERSLNRMRPTLETYAAEIEAFYSGCDGKGAENYLKGVTLVVSNFTEYGRLFQRAVANV